MNNELVNKIYDSNINLILNGLDEIYMQEISTAYKNYLNNLYLNLEIKQGKNLNELLVKFIELENSKWKNISIELKLSMLLQDEAFKKINHISNTGFKYAKDRISQINVEGKILPPVINVETAEQEIANMKNLLTKVRKFNIKSSKTLISEGIMDFAYACGKIEVTSLRLAHQV